MKNFIKLFSLSLLVLPCLLFFAACDSSVELEASHINLSYYTTTYNAQEQKPTVSVIIDEKTIDENQYDVTYSNNINAGKAKVTITAKENATQIYGSVSVNFYIEPGTTTVDNFDDLSNSLQNPNFSKIELTNDLTIEKGTTLVIPENKELLVKNCNFNVLGNIENNGYITAEVSNRTQLSYAFEYANKIVLSSNITSILVSPISVISDDRALTFELDLNGFNISLPLSLSNQNSSTQEFYSYKINAYIYDSSEEKTGTLGSQTCQYGIAVFGNANVTLKMKDITLLGSYYALVTNGLYQGASIEAENCVFGNSETLVGCYLPAKYKYKFTNCTFEGTSGYYTKSGTHILNNCIINATSETYDEPVYNGNGAYLTGSALIIDSAEGYHQPMTVTINGGRYSSISGYGIEEYSTGKTEETKPIYATIEIENMPEFNCSKGNYSSMNNLINNA